MANNFEVGQKIVNRALAVIRTESALLPYVDRQYEEEFGARGGKPGDTIYVRRPPQYTIRDGAVANLQDVNQSKMALTVQPEFGVDMAISDFDLANSFDRLDEDIITPAAVRLAAELDVRLFRAAYLATANSVGTPGSAPGSTQAAQKLALDAGVVLGNNGAVGKRMMVTSLETEANLMQYLNLGFNSQSKIGDQYETGSMQGKGLALGFNWMSSPNAVSHTVGALGGTPLVNGANQGTTNSGATDNPRADTTSIVTDGWTASVATRVKKGDTFTLAGVYMVNPLTKATTARLMQFTATADAASDGSGNMTIVASPAIIAGGAFQNVSARPADNAALTFTGTASTAYPVSLAFAPQAYTLATVPMELPGGMEIAKRATMDGVSIRFVRGYDILNNRRINRFDIMAAYGAPRPEWGVRVYS